jgi:hypothetical protein
MRDDLRTTHGFTEIVEEKLLQTLTDMLNTMRIARPGGNPFVLSIKVIDEHVVLRNSLLAISPQQFDTSAGDWNQFRSRILCYISEFPKTSSHGFENNSEKDNLEKIVLDTRLNMFFEVIRKAVNETKYSTIQIQNMFDEDDEHAMRVGYNIIFDGTVIGNIVYQPSKIHPTIGIANYNKNALEMYDTKKNNEVICKGSVQTIPTSNGIRITSSGVHYLLKSPLDSERRVEFRNKNNFSISALFLFGIAEYFASNFLQDKQGRIPVEVCVWLPVSSKPYEIIKETFPSFFFSTDNYQVQVPGGFKKVAYHLKIIVATCELCEAYEDNAKTVMLPQLFNINGLIQCIVYVDGVFTRIHLQDNLYKLSTGDYVHVRLHP